MTDPRIAAVTVTGSTLAGRTVAAIGPGTAGIFYVFDCQARPPLEEVGAQIVRDVHPYETMKLRLLNASHQAMAYLGYLTGYRYADEVIADAQMRTFIIRMMDDEVTDLLPPVPGIDLGDYKRTLIERFANPRIKDTLARLATDGSDRMPKFVLPSVVVEPMLLAQ